MDALQKDDALPARRRLAASPTMRARLGLAEPVAAPPLAARTENAAPIAAAAPPVARSRQPRPQLSNEERARRQEASRQVETLLRERWPMVFCVPRVPLAIGIHKQVLEAAGADIDPAALGRFFHWWVQRWDYLDAVAHGELRRSLDGSPAGEPAEYDRRAAAGKVYGPRAEAVLARIAERQKAPAAAAGQVKAPKPATV